MPYPGAGRRVYPGFIQLTNFIGMNLERHVQAHHELFDHLVTGDDDSATAKREFYEEFLAVLDLSADFYLDTVATVFHRHDLPKGEMKVRWQPVLPERITQTAILCIEGERDDISGVGQTRAALDITPNLPDDMKAYHLQPGAGHYGVFNGSRFRAEVAPRIRDFVRRFDPAHGGERAAQAPGRSGPDRRSRPRGGAGAVP
jgi:poly(3-hydroxybutyrate) depolymerase